MPALPPTPSRSSPKVTSTLANTDVLALGLKKFTPAETSPHTSCRSSSSLKVVPLETRLACLSSLKFPHRLPITNGSMMVSVAGIEPLFAQRQQSSHEYGVVLVM